MSRRPLRTHGRRFALGLSLLLVAGAIAVPAAFASDYTYTAFIDAVPVDAVDDTFTFTMTLKNTSTADRNLGSANVSFPGGIAVTEVVGGKLSNPKKLPVVIEYRELKIKSSPDGNGETGYLVFEARVTCGDLPETGPLFGVVAKASADFGGKGTTATLQPEEGSLSFAKTDLCPSPQDFDPDEFMPNGDSLIAFNYGSDAFEKVFFDAELRQFYGPQRSAFQAACQALVDAKPNLQLAQNGDYPVWSIPAATYDFSSTGGNITFSMIIPSDSTDRQGAPTFAACYAGEKPIGNEPPFMSASIDGENFDFYGPNLLDRCAVKRPEAPCGSQSKIKEEEASQFPVELGVNAGDFLLKILYPALDPWKS
jgi:hypothetical protein